MSFWTGDGSGRREGESAASLPGQPKRDHVYPCKFPLASRGPGSSERMVEVNLGDGSVKELE